MGWGEKFFWWVWFLTMFGVLLMMLLGGLH